MDLPEWVDAIIAWVEGRPGAIALLFVTAVYGTWWLAKNVALKSDVEPKVDYLYFKASNDAWNARMDQLGRIVQDVSIRTNDSIDKHAQETRETLRLYGLGNKEDFQTVHRRIDNVMGDHSRGQ